MVLFYLVPFFRFFYIYGFVFTLQILTVLWSRSVFGWLQLRFFFSPAPTPAPFSPYQKNHLFLSIFFNLPLKNVGTNEETSVQNFSVLSKLEPVQGSVTGPSNRLRPKSPCSETLIVNTGS